MDKRRELLTRVYFVFICFSVLSVVIMAKVVNVNVVQGDEWRKKAVNNLRWKKVDAERGDIFSENGSSMVTSITLFDIYMDLTVSREKDFKANIDSLCYYLEKYSGKEKSRWQWESELKKGRKDGIAHNKKGTKYYPIAKNLDYMEKLRFQQFPLFKLGQMGGGIIVRPKIRRVKPFGSMASYLLGIDRKDAINVGLENSYDTYLKGETKKKLMKEIAHGVWVPVQEVEDKSSTKGYDLTTTIDVDIQDVVHNELLSAMYEHDADQGTAIVMDVETGAIKAMSNFNRTADEKFAEMQNVAVTRMFAPGSTIKLATVLALLEDGYVTPESSVNLHGGKHKFYGEVMKDSEPHGIYETDVRTAFAKSSNVGIGGLADVYYNQDKEGKRKFIRHFKSYGFGEKSGIDLTGEPNEFLNDPDRHGTKFSLTSVPWMAHGYEMKMTPLQVLAFYNAIANGGKMMKPYVVKSITDNSQVIKEFSPKVSNSSVASIAAIHEAQGMLREVVVSGTARKLNTKHYGISGKTGTSKDYGVVVDGKNPYNASFAGYFPSEDPKYSMIVVLFNPRNHGHYGGVVAGPVFKNVADKIFALKLDLKSEHYTEYREHASNTAYSKPKFTVGHRGDIKNILKHSNVPSKEESKATWVILNPYQEKLALQKRSIKKSTVPDVVGMGVRDAIYILENIGLKVKINGAGKVRHQSITPGTKNEGQEIFIQLG